MALHQITEIVHRLFSEGNKGTFWFYLVEQQCWIVSDCDNGDCMAVDYLFLCKFPEKRRYLNDDFLNCVLGSDGKFHLIPSKLWKEAKEIYSDLYVYQVYMKDGTIKDSLDIGTIIDRVSKEE